jgi:hypothetical protein
VPTGGSTSESHTELVVRLVMEAQDEGILQQEKARLLEIMEKHKESKEGTS